MYPISDTQQGLKRTIFGKVVGQPGYIRIMPQPPGPRKPEEKKRTKWLRVRLTPETDALIKAAAETAGITVSAWATERLVSAAKKEGKAAYPAKHSG